MDAQTRSRRTLLPIFIMIFIDLLGVGIVIPVLAPILLSEESMLLAADTPFGTRTFIYGLLLGSFTIAQFFGAPILGALSDHYGRKKLLLISMAGTAAGYFLFGFGLTVSSLTLLFIGRLTDGFTGGNLSIALSSIADVSTDAGSKTRNFGLLGVAFGLGFILGPVMGGILSDPNYVSWFGFETPFYTAGILILIDMLLMQILFHETLKVRIKTPISLLTGIRNIGTAFRLRHLRTIFIVIFLTTIGFTAFTQFFQIFLVDKYQFDQSDIGVLFTYVGAWIALTQGGLLRPLSRTFTPLQLLRVSILGLGLTFPFMLLPYGTWFLYTLLPLIAVFQGLILPSSTAIVSGLAGEDSQGEVMGINQSISSLAQSVPPIVGGIIAGMGSEIPIILAGVLTIAGWFALMNGFRGKPRVFHER